MHKVRSELWGFWKAVAAGTTRYGSTGCPKVIGLLLEILDCSDFGGSFIISKQEAMWNNQSLSKILNQRCQCQSFQEIFWFIDYMSWLLIDLLITYVIGPTRAEYPEVNKSMKYFSLLYENQAQNHLNIFYIWVTWKT